MVTRSGVRMLEDRGTSTRVKCRNTEHSAGRLREVTAVEHAHVTGPVDYLS